MSLLLCYVVLIVRNIDSLLCFCFWLLCCLYVSGGTALPVHLAVTKLTVYCRPYVWEPRPARQVGFCDTSVAAWGRTCVHTQARGPIALSKFRGPCFRCVRLRHFYRFLATPIGITRGRRWTTAIIKKKCPPWKEMAPLYKVAALRPGRTAFRLQVDGVDVIYRESCVHRDTPLEVICFIESCAVPKKPVMARTARQ